MARTKRPDTLQRRLLTLWEAPANAGAPVGVLATTFTFDAALFEEECLARFAGVQSDPRRDGALYRIEREEKLANLICAAVVVDIHHCAGQRSLRWDLLAARPARGVMHAKVSLLAWRDHVRILIGSANLTDSGYRQNQECIATLDFTDANTDRTLLSPLLQFLGEILAITDGPARTRAEALLSWVDERLSANHAAPVRGLQRRLILIGPRRSDYFEQLQERLPAGPPEEAHVVSPFFDPELRETGPERRLWVLLKKRGKAELHLHVAGEESIESSGWRLEAPSHVQDATPTGRREVSLSFHPVMVRGVTTDSGRENRPLHGKMLLLSNPNWCLLAQGSSNFTSAGMGLSRANNYEANVVYSLVAPEADRLRVALEQRFLQGGAAVEINPGVKFEPAIDGDGEDGSGVPPLPGFFSLALFKGATDAAYSIRLELGATPPEGDWSIRAHDIPFIDSMAWAERGEPQQLDLALERKGPPPSVLTVSWYDAQHTAQWPLVATGPGVLPTPTELQGLSLAALLDLLGSIRPLHEALRAWLKHLPNDDDSEIVEAIEVVDPHAKVDTSDFLVKRVQRACWAIRELRVRLEQPVLSASAMVWRLDGPLGAQAVLAAIDKQCDPSLPDEWTFLLCEMLRELRAVKLTSPGGHPPEGEPASLFSAFLEELQQLLAVAASTASAEMQSYVRQALANEFTQEVSHEAA